MSDQDKCNNEILVPAGRRDLTPVAVTNPLVSRGIADLFARSLVWKSHSATKVSSTASAEVAANLHGEFDVMPLSMGFETPDGTMTRLFDRNTIIPATKKAIVRTTEDHQATVTLKVYMGNWTATADDHLFAVYNLAGIKVAPRWTPQIEVTFTIDANGILSLTARELGPGKELTVHCEECTGGLSQDDIDRIREMPKQATI
jgi:molecular chaperone DnaK (HSP70)